MGDQHGCHAVPVFVTLSPPWLKSESSPEMRASVEDLDTDLGQQEITQRKKLVGMILKSFQQFWSANSYQHLDPQ